MTSPKKRSPASRRAQRTGQEVHSTPSLIDHNLIAVKRIFPPSTARPLPAEFIRANAGDQCAPSSHCIAGGEP
jgi:hypothetical protein